jgi:hypothetical protein
LALVIVEREFSGPDAVAAFFEKDASSGPFLEAHGVRRLRSYVAADGSAAASVYEAKDAESVHVAETAAGLPFLRVWTAELERYLEETPPPPAAIVVMQRDLPVGTTFAVIGERRIERKHCLDLHRTAPVETFLALDGTRSVCVASAPDAEAVRRANRALDMPVTSIWRAEVRG